MQTLFRELPLGLAKLQNRGHGPVAQVDRAAVS